MKITDEYKETINQMSNPSDIYELLSQIKGLTFIRLKQLNPSWSDRELSKQLALSAESNTTISKMIKRLEEGHYETL